MAARPLVAEYKITGGVAEAKPLPLPAVFLSPIRNDIVRFVHTSMNKNRRQPYAVKENAGHQHSAESWGTGRAVSRIPRVSGGGNSRSGQAAFGNMCRKGRMFGPTKIWRKWHKKVNQNQKRYAVVSALAASALPALVMARGHRIEQVPEVPLVADASLEKVTRTKEVVAALKALGAYDDVKKCRDSRKLRAGIGKLRNRRHVMRRGPLIVYEKDDGLVRAVRNLPGVETAQVERLNLLQLAPGGHLGRFIIWTRDAITKLNDIWGSVRRESSQKRGYHLPRARMTNSDLGRIINSDEVQSKVKPANKVLRRALLKKNPLKNLGAKVKLNPYALALRRSELLAQERRQTRKAAILADKRGQLPDRSREEANSLAAAKTHQPQQKVNYKKLTVDGFAGTPAKLVVKKGQANIKRRS